MAIVGISRTDVLGEFLQLLARGLFCYISIEHTDESKGPFIWFAFFAFAIAETIRYPYYLFKMLGMEDTGVGKFFGLLRYNMFIVFYPMGAFSDLMTGYYSAPALKENGKYSLLLPNKYNFSFDYSYFIGVIIPALYVVFLPMNYMQLLAQRKKYFGA